MADLLILSNSGTSKSITLEDPITNLSTLSNDNVMNLNPNGADRIVLHNGQGGLQILFNTDTTYRIEVRKNNNTTLGFIGGDYSTSSVQISRIEGKCLNNRLQRYLD